MDAFFLSLVIALLFSLGLVAVMVWYLLSLRRHVSSIVRAIPKKKTLVLSHRDIGPIIGTDLVVEFEKVPEDAESDAVESDVLRDENDSGDD
ncbi:hypothetical protein E6H16_01370 [Candidatus Bathyarchaeota archaeon]|nr:MAG: hypothetical protein E6H16_01370 [Candidatus Bathyarchaeota archaeon]HLC11172.1 hypothetical protein [Candidatus Bathyarchaeia archaeon]